MPEHGEHCPFLNRTDARCSTHFSLDRLTHAFEHCFDHYKACPVYIELLVERRLRRAGAAPGGHASNQAWSGPIRTGDADAPAAIIPLAISHRYAQHVAVGEVVPAAPRF